MAAHARARSVEVVLAWLARSTTRHARWVLLLWAAAALLATAARPLDLAEAAQGLAVPIVILLAVFRAPPAALVPVATAVLTERLTTVAVPALGLGSPPAPLVYGTATIYAAMLLHRFRERLRAGDPAEQAVRAALDRTLGVVVTATAAWAASCAALLLADHPQGPAPAAAGLLALPIVLTVVPAVLAVVGERLFWPSRAWRRTRADTAAARFGRRVARRPGRWGPAACALLAGLAVAGPATTRAAPPATVVLVAGVLTVLVLALALRSLVAPVYLGVGALSVAWAAGTASPAGAETPVFLLALAATVSAGLLVLARARQTAAAGRPPRVRAALAVRYAGPPACAALLVAGSVTIVSYGPLPGLAVVLGGLALSVVLVPGLTALLGRRAWWPDTDRHDATPLAVSRVIAPPSPVGGPDPTARP